MERQGHLLDEKRNSEGQEAAVDNVIGRSVTAFKLGNVGNSEKRKPFR